MAKDKDYIKMIHTTQWLKLRRDVLTKHPLCESCREAGVLTPAVEVHHIVPVEDGLSKREKERLMFSPSNLRALCHACHAKIHTELGRGKKHTQRQSKEQLKQFVKKFFDDS